MVIPNTKLMQSEKKISSGARALLGPSEVRKDSIGWRVDCGQIISKDLIRSILRLGGVLESARNGFEAPSSGILAEARRR